MKRIFVLPLLLLATWVCGQNIEGAWKLTHQNGSAVSDKEYVKIYQDGYFAFGAKEVGTNKFISAGGGNYGLQGKDYHEILDFYTANPEWVGRTNKFGVSVTGNKMTITSSDGGNKLEETWEKIGDREDALTANWVITGRKRDNEISRSTPGARRTIKILGGGRFQWVAFNSETKEFSGTGGGTYTAENGKYVESIEFFSRDDSRVGAQLDFDFQVVDGEWHHSGLSSTGNPIYEIWSKYSIAYKPIK